jgi:hypothetical protein
MKKTFCLLAAFCLVAALSTSCVKNCTCKAWTVGVAGDEYEIELDKDYYKTCSDMNTYEEVEGVKTGIECR